MKLKDLREDRAQHLRKLAHAVAVLDHVLAGPGSPGGRDIVHVFRGLSDPSRRQLLVALYDSGSSLDELRALSGLGASAVRAAVGDRVRHLSRLNDDLSHWNRGLDQGTSIAQLAADAGCSTSHLYRHLRRLGVWPRREQDFAEWLEERTEMRDGCLVWTAELNGRGLPMAKRHGRSGIARRLVWQHHHGPVDDTLYVTATRNCTHPVICVAEHHSRLLTPQEAASERAAAGRVAHGEDHGHARLSEAQAQAILTSPQTQRELARRFGVSSSTVQAIKSRRRWKHLRAP